MRPPILDKDGKLSKFVKGIIKDREGNLVGLVLVTDDYVVIEFLSKISICFILDKKTKEVSVEAEKFVKDPKNLLQAVC